jgi:hypothetical protein
MMMILLLYYIKMPYKLLVICQAISLDLLDLATLHHVMSHMQ